MAFYFLFRERFSHFKQPIITVPLLGLLVGDEDHLYYIILSLLVSNQPARIPRIIAVQGQYFGGGQLEHVRQPSTRVSTLVTKLSR